MTVDEELRELADHELDVMRARLEALASKCEAVAATHAETASMVEEATGKRSTHWHGYAEMLEVCARHLRNVLAGRDAEDDGR